MGYLRYFRYFLAADLCVILTDNSSHGYDMGWWREEHFNASDADGDGFLNITEFNE